ncbi:A/G-specific adenine glycosylase [Hydrogenophaga sp. PAMC20947]|uniref:A/G-specific adenine glycosylase n=1 Tax=Hydrogenophaga sp. PAMC20947 TaxID=2565558 RepID=UPI00109DF20F|nr:A/G-specific adenine glycosylase [Hydrogenophaga sp. PAMC20947]QCB46548.1 A/G-specific adenine glycosylase [Hydrogenophaga sp. PAMC20947]
MSSGFPLPTGFARSLVDWQRHSGRHGLPWQGSRDPYRVWLSEVMLQQTQVSTVLNYFPRFLARFPDVNVLAAAPQDDVMALWSGLGYYSRARNLHRCAQIVSTEHGGVFPDTALALQALPGIGASTAAAIAAFCHGERVSILDGNVRRVLTRLLAFDEDLALASAQKRLWGLAQALLPEQPTGDDMAAYTQGLMDLGATLCTRSRPACERCPVHATCQGFASGQPTRFPVKTRTLKRRHESWWLAILVSRSDDGVRRVWLERRPSRGIWADLYCPPVWGNELDARSQWAAARLVVQDLEPVSHSLTHRELRLHPLLVDTPDLAGAPNPEVGQWVRWEDLSTLGLPAPVRSMLDALQQGQ